MRTPAEIAKAPAENIEASTDTGAPAGASPSQPAGLDRLILRIDRLELVFRFTFAFHAREVRFECDSGEGFVRIFPETFSFRVGRHDPAELFFQLDDLLNHPELLSPTANRRDAQELVTRLLTQTPRYLEKMLKNLEDRLEGLPLMRLQQDIALFCQIAGRFLESRDLASGRRSRVALMLMRKLTYRALDWLVQERVEPAYLEQYIRGEVDPVDPTDDPSDSGFFHTMETGEPEAVNRMLVRMAEREFYIWLDGTCLDDENRAFEKEDSPFGSRESEVMLTICVRSATSIERSSDLVPYLRRPSKDCRQLLDRLERWFLRRYDIRVSSALIYHEASLDDVADRGDPILSWHTPRNHALALLALASPFIAAAFFYDHYPEFFNILCSIDVAVVNIAAIWFLGYRFCWKRDLSFFHAAVPRIGAGIIVGYLPVFLIDEVWDLARQSFFILGAVSLFLGLVTLLYIYVEVQRRLADADLAFARARAIFLLGLVQAFGIGVVMTNLVGHFMILRNWTNEPGASIGDLIESGIEPLIGQLPRIVGIEPLLAFPSAVLVMTFLSFFIGVFLQLMWEELPITEPL